MKGVGGTRDLKSLNEGRQATLLSSLFWSCVQPKFSNGLWHFALLQTRVCVCVCWCIANIASACLASTSVQFLSYVSAFIRRFLTSSACLLGAFRVFGQRGAYLCVRRGLSEPRCRGRGRSLRVFGLGPRSACADCAGAWRENPEKERNKQVAAESHMCVCLVITSAFDFPTHASADPVN